MPCNISITIDYSQVGLGYVGGDAKIQEKADKFWKQIEGLTTSKDLKAVLGTLVNSIIIEAKGMLEKEYNKGLEKYRAQIPAGKKL